jgi:rare lipoprotein A
MIEVSFKNNFILTLTLSLICLMGYSQSVETGMASFYSDAFEGKQTASGEIYKSSKMTAAHRTLPFGTEVKVTNLSNQRTVKVTVNDRGPFAKGRVIDLSRAAAVKLDFVDQGVTKVQIEPIKTSKK